MADNPSQSSSKSSGNVLTNKVGPLPMWGWMAIVAVLAFIYYKYKQGQSGTVTSPTTTDQNVAANTPGGVDSSLVPQFINQTYNQETPPAAPNVTVNNTVPTPAPTTSPVASSTPPAPTTISGAPGSYTTNTGNSSYPDEWTSNGQYSLATIASSHGMSVQQLIAASEAAENNVPLQNYVKTGNYNAKLPSGVQLFFPAANWKVK